MEIVGNLHSSMELLRRAWPLCFGGHAALSVSVLPTKRTSAKKRKDPSWCPKSGELKEALEVRSSFLKNQILIFKPLLIFFHVCFLSFCGDSAAIFFSLQFMDKLALTKKETSTEVTYTHIGHFIAFPKCTVCKKRWLVSIFFSL